MAQHQAPLQLLQLLRRNARLRQQAEAGVDAVDGVVMGEHLRDRRRTRLDAGTTSRIESEPRRLAPEAAQRPEPELARDDGEIGGARAPRRPPPAPLGPALRATT